MSNRTPFLASFRVADEEITGEVPERVWPAITSGWPFAQNWLDDAESNQKQFPQLDLAGVCKILCVEYDVIHPRSFDVRSR